MNYIIAFVLGVAGGAVAAYYILKNKYVKAVEQVVNAKPPTT